MKTLKAYRHIPARTHSNLAETKPTLFQPLIDAINQSTVKTEITISPEAKKILYTTIGTLSAAIVIAALINKKNR